MINVTQVPCDPVTSIEVSPSTQNVDYILRDDAIDNLSVQFSALPSNACEHSFDITVTGMPSFVTYEVTDDGLDFSVPSFSDLDSVGDFEATVTATLSGTSTSTSEDISELE